MIHKAGDSIRKRLVDCMGTEVPNVIQFDDETQVATLIIVGKNMKMGFGESHRLTVVKPIVAELDDCHAIGSFQHIQVDVHIPGAKIVVVE